MLEFCTSGSVGGLGGQPPGLPGPDYPLRPGYVEGWQELRAKLEARRARRKQRRFRHDPAAYLAKLEQQCLQLTLPP